MARYIDADKLVEMYERAVADEWNQKTSPASWADAYDCVLADIDDQPTLNVAIVKHGEWIDTVTGYACSICHTQEPTKRFLYCPNCGAKMDGGKAE